MMNIYEKIIEFQKNNIPFVIVTIIRKEGHGPQVPGAKMLVRQNGNTFGSVGGGSIEFIAIQESINIINSQEKTIIKDYILGEDNNIIDAIDTGMICGGKLSLFYEYIVPADSLYIFGAGHIGKAISYHIKKLNYNTTLIDSREEISSHYSRNEQVIISSYDKIFDNKIVKDNAYIIIATHSHEIDYNVLKNIFKHKLKPKYVGLIASKKKSIQILERLSREFESEKPDISNLYTPVGLKTGGSEPHEIAISIIAELQTIKYAQEGHKHFSNNPNNVNIAKK